MNSKFLCCDNLSKSFGQIVALDNVNLEIKEGEIFGLLGPNGAGKTTLIRCILGLINPSQGEIFFKQRPLHSDNIQKKFGFLPENFQPPAQLSAAEFLDILGKAFNLGASAIDLYLKEVGISQQKDKPMKAFSRGMIQRLGIVLCLLKQPQVIILDEPTLGLDPLGQRDILSLLLKLNNQGKTIFFSSHILSQIEKVCHRIGIINEGRLIFIGRISKILKKHKCTCLEEAFLKEVCQDAKSAFSGST